MVKLFGGFFEAAGATQGFGDNPLKLTVGRAELIGSPRFHRCHCAGIDAKYETLCLVTVHFVEVRGKG